MATRSSDRRNLLVWAARHWAASFCVSALCLGVAKAADTPDPVALLRGVEGVRQACRSGRVEMRLKVSYPQSPKQTPQDIRLSVAFDGPNLRFDQYQRIVIVESTATPDPTAQDRVLKSLGGDLDAFVRAGHGRFQDVHVRGTFDGTQFMEYSEDGGAIVKDLTKGSPGLILDPRILGISTWVDIGDTVSDCMRYRNAKLVTVVDRGVFDGSPCWQVRVLDSYNQDRRFWIADDGSFRVRKSSFSPGRSRRETTSKYGKPDRVVPESAMISTFDHAGLLKELIEISVTQAEYNKPVDPKLWSLAGLKIPLGAMLIDERIHRVVGHFDGEGLTANFTEAVKKGDASRRRPLLWVLAVTGLVVLSVLAAALVHRRNLLRREA